ncbi:MAG: inverse autotransporter beta domain-containing protein [Hyphomicrobiales bacterium]|nr:inverse autotransporter beta domain-containing protein [Hyphomicrobiales bacterium]
MFPHKLLLPLGALLLSGLVGASSSGAQDALFVRTQGEIERLWSSALGCAERGSSFAIRDRFNGSESTYGSLPAGGSSDYSQCGERALRNTSSRMLVDTIEDAVRSGGLSLFNSDFRLDSSINWIWGENVTGDLDAVVPLLLIGKEDQGSGHALFLQPGLSFWPGLEDERRLDGNLGVVYRTRMADGLVAGGSFFYDYDVKNDNRRIGVGLDLQDRALHAGLNYYHPLNEWQEGRTDYEEQPLQGGDFRLGLALQRAWLDASMGVWRFEGEGKTKWRPSLGMDAGIRILPGVFLKGGYEWQDEDDSFGTRWSTGLAFRFALPGLDGAGSFNSPPVPAPNLFDPVEREKRILYEEREAVPKANLSVSGTGNTRNVIVQLDEIFTEDVVLNFIGSGSATYNDDWTMSVGGTDCAAVTGTNCQVTVMAGETSPSDGVVITFQDPDRGEPAEDIILSVEIASTGVDLAPGNPLIVQIPAGLPLPNISLSSDKTSIAEGDTATITLTLSEMLGDAAAFNLIGSSDSNDVTYGTSTDDDWNLSIGGTACDMASGTSCQVTIAAGATSAEVTVEVNADTTSETSLEAFTVSVEVDSGSRSIVQTGSRSTLNFTIPADPPLPTVSLNSDKTNIAEGDTATITLTLSEMLGDAAAFNLIGGSDSNDVTYGASNDWNLSIDGTDCDMASGMNCQVTIAAGATSAEVTVEVNADTTSETSLEAFTVSVEVDSGSRSIVQTGSRSTLNFTIPEDPPSTLGFAETGITTDETISAGNQFIQVRGVAKDADGMKFSSIPVRIPITISITNNAGNDITIDTSPGQALTPANTDNFNSDNEFLIQAIRIVDDTDTEDQEEFVITLGEGPGFPAGWAIDPDADTFTITINKNDQPSTLGFAETGITTDETISAGNQFIQVRGVAKDADGMKFSSIPVRIPITISITNNAGNDITIDTSPGQALTPANTDNFNSDNEFLIQAIRIVDDTDAEEQEEFVVTLGEGPGFPAGWAIDPDADTFTITINRNDQPSTLGFAGTGITTDETISTGNQFIQLRGVAKDADGMKFSSIPVRIPITISITNNAGNDITIDTSSGQALTPAGTDNFNSDNEFLIQAIRIVDDTDAEDQEEFVITLGEGPSFPDGWVIDSDADTFTIVINGNDRPTVFFSGGDGTQSVPRTITDTIDEGAGGSATVTLNLSPAPTTAINIPLTVTGNHAVYGDVIIANTTRAAVLGNPSTNDVRVSVPANIGMVILRITVVQDSGNNSDDITVSLGALPGDYAAGTNNSWAVAINFPRTVNFAYEGEHSLRTSTNPETAEVADLSLELSKTHNEDITVHLNKGGTAGATNGDYRILNQDGSICGADNEVCVVTFPPGQKEAVVKFWPRRYFSGSETAIINIQIPEGSKDSVQLGKQDEIQFNLIDGTASAVLPTVTLSYTGDRILTSSTTSEIAEIVDLKVQLNNSSSVPIAVHLNKGGTTRAGSGDYRILNADDSICGNDDESCIVTFLAGQTEVVVKFWPRRYIAEQETAVIELEVPAENRDKVALGLNNRVEFTLVPGI